MSWAMLGSFPSGPVGLRFSTGVTEGLIGVCAAAVAACTTMRAADPTRTARTFRRLFIERGF